LTLACVQDFQSVQASPLVVAAAAAPLPVVPAAAVNFYLIEINTPAQLSARGYFFALFLTV
jgi:hypothetical protein